MSKYFKVGFDGYPEFMSESVTDNIIKSSNSRDRITTDHVAKFYGETAYQIHKLLFSGSFLDPKDLESDAGEMPYSYEMYEELGYIKYEGMRCLNSLYWTPKGIRFLVNMLADIHIYPKK